MNIHVNRQGSVPLTTKIHFEENETSESLPFKFMLLARLHRYTPASLISLQ